MTAFIYPYGPGTMKRRWEEEKGVYLEVSEVIFLVKRSRLKTERVDYVVDLHGAVLEGLSLFIGRGVCA